MKIIIVGGGIAGLTLAYQLVKKGLQVTVLERENRVGGLARSYHYDNWSIDIGPHRFHTDDPLVEDFIQDVMKENLIEIERNSKVFFCDAHFDWPLNLRSLLQLPPSLMLRAGLDLLIRPKITDDSYESYVMNRYGKTLTNFFFRVYNEKFLKVGLKDCHRDWAETGINRATIDKDIKSSSITDLLLGVLSQKEVNTRFLYPKTGPIDLFPEILRERIKALGGTVEVDVTISGATVEDRTVKRIESLDGRTWDADYLVWTGDPNDLEKLLNLPLTTLNYNSTVLCNLLVEGDPLVPSQWEYFGSRDFIFCRTSTNTCFNPCLAPEGYYGICAELLCYENDYVWKQPETLLNSVIQNLIHSNLVRNFNSIMDVNFEWVKNTYPIYKIDYLEHLNTYKKKIANMKNVLACGRTGGFWYNNMDHSIRSSIDIADKFDPEKLSGGGQPPASGVWRGDF